MLSLVLPAPQNRLPWGGEQGMAVWPGSSQAKMETGATCRSS